MNRVETISINGVIFSIADDACRMLSDYLDSLYKYFEHEKGGNEIIADIEARIAELFAERAGGIAQAITDKDVSHVIETLGSLEDITSSNDDANDNHFDNNQKKYTKRLYRDLDRNVLGGVCAGIATWLEINPVLVRLIFVACFFFYGISIIAYFLLWIIIPVAKTTAQKLEMQGQQINISNIERSIRGNMSSSSSSGLRSSSDTVELGINKLFRAIWSVIRIVAGIILCCIGISMTLSFLSLFLLHDFIFEWTFFPFNGFFPHIISASSYNAIFISTILFALLTVAACIYWGIKAITGSMVKYPPVHVVLLIIWFLTIPLIATYAVREAGNYFGYSESIKTTHITTRDTIYLNLKPSDIDMSNYRFGAYFDDENNRFYGKPAMYIRKSAGMSKLQIVKTSRGKNNHKAFTYANDIDYQFEVENSRITLAPFYTVKSLNGWKNQRLQIILSVPENTVIIVDESLCYSDIIRPRRSGHDGNVCKWIVTNAGIMPID
jgi:phage shock protein PspC (stress-responsive transcriptional regulator)